MNDSEMNKWFSEKDVTPECFSNFIRLVLICQDYKYFKVGFYFDGKWKCLETKEELKNVTHWLPLPEVPQKP